MDALFCDKDMTCFCCKRGDKPELPRKKIKLSGTPIFAECVDIKYEVLKQMSVIL
jgi:hypothetical protein